MNDRTTGHQCSVMNLIKWKLIFGCIISATSISGVLLSGWFSSKKSVVAMTCFTAGVLLSSSLINILDDAEHDPNLEDTLSFHFPLMHLFSSFGVLMSLTLNFIFKQRSTSRGVIPSVTEPLLESSPDSVELQQIGQQAVPLIRISSTKLFIAMNVLEDFFGGLALGMQSDIVGASVIFFSIVSFQWVESILLVILLRKPQEITKRWGANARKTILYVICFSFINYTGIVIALIIGATVNSMTTINFLSSSFGAFIAGNFLYISTVEMLGGQLERNELTRNGMMMTIFGFLLSAFSGLLVMSMKKYINLL